jgi:hypothetical protein
MLTPAKECQTKCDSDTHPLSDRRPTEEGVWTLAVLACNALRRVRTLTAIVRQRPTQSGLSSSLMRMSAFG